MKTAIIQLETHDDLISIRDKISWSKSQRIILVLPSKIKRIPEVLDLRLMQRSARAHGAAIALVTRDRWVIENATEVGIPVFNSVPQAEKAIWQRGTFLAVEKEHPKGLDQILVRREEIRIPNKSENLNPILRIFIFLLSLTALFTLAVYVIPSAKINVYPLARTQEITVDITASTNVKGVNITGLIPASEKKLTLTMEKTANSTGMAILPQSKASGVVTVTSLTMNEVFLPAGVIFTSSGENPIHFTSKEEAMLTPDDMTADIKIEALLPGADGNVESGQITVVEGVYGTMVKVTNLEPITGGSSLTVPSPNEEDYEKLRAEIKIQLFDQALKEAINEQTESEKVINESLLLDKIISEIQSNPVGEPSDTLKLTMKAQYRVLVYDPQDVLTLANQIFDASILKDVHAANVAPLIEEVGKVTQSDKDTYQWQVKGIRWIVENWDQNELRRLVKGKSVDEAIRIINMQLPNNKSAEVITKPGFWRRMPYLPGSIVFEEIIIP